MKRAIAPNVVAPATPQRRARRRAIAPRFAAAAPRRRARGVLTPRH